MPQGWNIKIYSIDGCCLPGLNTHGYLLRLGFYLLSTNGSSFACQYYMKIQPLSTRQGDLTTFDRQICPACRIIDNKVVKSPPIPPLVPGWGEVGHYFVLCIIVTLATLVLRATPYNVYSSVGPL